MSPSLFFGLVAAAILLYATWRWRQLVGMKTWKPISARLLKVEEVKRPYSAHGITAYHYVPKIEYEYVVDGQTFRSGRFSLHNFTMSDQGEINEVLRYAKVGEMISTYYDPRNPQSATLTFPSTDGLIGLVFVGTALLGLDLLLTFAAK